MSNDKFAALIYYGLAIGAGVAVAVGWYGLATTLGLASVLLMVEYIASELRALIARLVVNAEK